MLHCDSDLEVVSKQHTALMDFEQRKMVRDVVEDIVKETLSQSSENFDKKQWQMFF